AFASWMIRGKRPRAESPTTPSSNRSSRSTAEPVLSFAEALRSSLHLWSPPRRGGGLRRGFERLERLERFKRLPQYRFIRQSVMFSSSFNDPWLLVYCAPGCP